MPNKKRKTSPGQQHEAAAKRKRIKRSKLQLISLPTDILFSVLSKLPLKEALRTSVLSTQWKHVWRGGCTKLDFTRKTILTKNERTTFTSRSRDDNRKMFIKRVNSIIRQHSGIGIEQFRVIQPLHNEHADYVDTWVNYAIESKAKELVLDMDWEAHGPEIVPYDFFSHSTNTNSYMHLNSLELNFVSLRLPADFTGFPNLTKLNLESVNITNEDTEHLLFICTLLVSLRIAHCKMLTSLRTRHLNKLKHLVVLTCPLLQEIELNCGITQLDYRGPIIPLALARSLRLTNICIKLSTKHSAIDFIFSEIPNTLHDLEVLTLRCTHIQRAVVPTRIFKFDSLRHLRLETIICRKKLDVLDLACLLEAAPFLEKFELHMVMNRDHRRYCLEDGELRRLPSYPHCHLNMVHITGFYGQKDQLELALYVLNNATMLKEMKVEISSTVHEPGKLFCASFRIYSDGYSVASEFLGREDHNNVVHILGSR
ncbi:putative F-box/LRR-repeat protein At3g28410 [Brachypodium distachyon]|uniref:F-box domain-containing protein n=1 Tax=Brachypodium distachyon TaxID=15368 RepID=I1J2S5_BRADI|nr:putative F-box/LRR-repeat protein At3g28410 [Brachypodium distachyon]KQJ85038.1 hypothetical protein BRADI_5g24490v3 [Brachypodium distachyon]|eukprot:XP_003579406.1 putative F-box/LRR-repeat protein At3g28410 [Brachypodium distachyon]